METDLGRNNSVRGDVAMPDKAEKFTIAVIAIIAVSISVFDLFGMLDGLPWLANKLPTINLLIVSLVAGYLAIERSHTLAGIQASIVDGVDQIINSLNGVSVLHFSNS